MPYCYIDMSIVALSYECAWEWEHRRGELLFLLYELIWCVVFTKHYSVLWAFQSVGWLPVFLCVMGRNHLRKALLKFHQVCAPLRVNRECNLQICDLLWCIFPSSSRFKKAMFFKIRYDTSEGAVCLTLFWYYIENLVGTSLALMVLLFSLFILRMLFWIKYTEH